MLTHYPNPNPSHVALAKVRVTRTMLRRQACRHGERGARSHARPSRRPDGRVRGGRAAYYGHKHTYQRTFPIFAGAVTPNNADGSNNGTIYYTAGNAGARIARTGVHV